ncbi:MAG: DUF4912 domain-containing protein [Candidatus Omnitrophica bacterium]|nr:DUF4912 domain-containing protein [Candidatus Omnitrophota bacterium]
MAKKVRKAKKSVRMPRASKLKPDLVAKVGQNAYQTVNRVDNTPTIATFNQQQNPSENVRRKDFRFPPGYGDNRIVILVRDPWWIFSYWEIRKDKEEEVLRRIESSGDGMLKSVLRVYDVTDVNFNGKNAHSYFDIDLTGLANSWYINVGKPERAWVVDIGIVTRKGGFYLLARSNMVKTPRFGMSDQFDAEWMMPEEEYWKMFSLSGGFGLGKASMDVREMVKRYLEEQVTSGGLSSGASVMGRQPSERKFWLVVNCELIVYGATEPDAKVTLQGKPLKLRQDGTFSVRFALPDGIQSIPVEAKSNDGIDVRRITPIVTRKTE